MELKYLATHLPDEDHLKFGIISAKRGMSKSALLRKILKDFITSDGKQKPAAKKGGKA